MMRSILFLFIILTANFVSSDKPETTETPAENSDSSDGFDTTDTTEKPENATDENRFWGRRCPSCNCPSLYCPPHPPVQACPPHPPAQPCPSQQSCPYPSSTDDDRDDKKDICPFGGFVTCNCDLDCPDDEEFVCGSDGVTYQNECFLKQARCEAKMRITIRKRGSCKKNTRITQCPRSCAHVPTSTVCNSEGYRLNNICELKKDNCGQKSLKVYHRKSSVCS